MPLCPFDPDPFPVDGLDELAGPGAPTVTVIKWSTVLVLTWVTTEVITDAPAVLQAVAEDKMFVKAAPEVVAGDVASADEATLEVAFSAVGELEGASVPETVTVEVRLTVSVTVARFVEVAADWVTAERVEDADTTLSVSARDEKTEKRMVCRWCVETLLNLKC